MTQPLTFEEFKLHAKAAKRVAVFEEINAGKLTPIMIYMLLNKALVSDGVILEDLRQQNTSRYSYICFNPIVSYKHHDNDNGDPIYSLRNFQSQLSYTTRPEVSDLITSAAGFITYDAVRYFENIPDRHTVDPLLPQLLFNFYRLSLAFNHEKQTILISELVDVGHDHELTYKHAREKINQIIKLLLSECDDGDFPITKHTTATVEVDTSDLDYMQMVEKAKKYIVCGDAFQIVISRCFKRNYSVSPLTIYKTLREVSPAPFMFYFPTETSVIVGASPERLIRVHNKQVTVNPIAGTRKRSEDTTDESIATDLLSDKKELAEHMMLVDLARNDVGTISNPGSVKVNELLHVKHYSHVSHITSTVTGQLQGNYDAFDAFVAAFPAGTLSGAPKIRAMQIIDELETSRRGLYGGAICRLDSLGNLDSCIAIRMAVLNNGVATIRTGAGIVYDSDPASEAQETYQKARSMLDAIAQAHGE